jgi:hypothetical protein
MQGRQTLPSQFELLTAHLAWMPIERPNHGTLTHLCQLITLHWHCTQNCTIEPETARSTRRTLSLTASIDDIAIATVEASAFRMKGAETEAFLEACDTISSSVCRMAEVAKEHWYLEDLRANDDLVVVERIVIHPDFGERGRMAMILRRALELLSPNPAITLLNAFPLEHENIDPPIEPAFTAAQQRLISYYAKAIGTKQLPSPFGRDGWLYKSEILPNDW